MAEADFDPFDQSNTPAVSWTTPEDSDVVYPVGTKRYFEATGKADCCLLYTSDAADEL